MKKSKEKLFKNSVIFLIGILSATSVLAQSFDGSSMAMGGAYGAVARGIDALAWNPANLALPRVHSVELNFVGLNIQVANSSINFKDYKRYFTYSGNKDSLWDENEIRNILNKIPNSGLRLGGDVGANVLGIAFLDYGISAEVVGNTSGLIPKGLTELYLRGNAKTQYFLDNTQASGFSALKIGLSAAQKIPFKKYFDVLSIGMKLNYYLGIATAEVVESKGVLYTGTSAIYYYSKIRARYANGVADTVETPPFSGKGFGIDLGAAGMINQKFTFSLVLQNLFGSLKWRKGTEEFLFLAPLDSFRIDYTPYEKPERTDTTYAIKAFSTSLPVVMHLGLAYQLKENLLLSLDLEQAFENRMGYSDQAKLAVGSEYRPLGWLPLRAGLSFGGKWGGYSVGLGFGLHAYVFEFDLAYLMQHALWPTYSNGASLAINMKFLF